MAMAIFWYVATFLIKGLTENEEQHEQRRNAT